MSFIQHISNWLISVKEAPHSDKQFLNWSQLSNVLILAFDHQVSDCIEFMNACKKDRIHAQVAVIFEGKSEQAPRPDFDYLLLHKKQFSFFGIPGEDCLQKFKSKPVDVLINMGDSKQFKAMALTKLIPAKCKIGNFENPVFDITINGDKSMNSSEYLKQVILYLNMIKTTTK